MVTFMVALTLHITWQEEKTRLPKRGGDDARKRREKLDAELEDLEYDSAYYMATVAYIEEVKIYLTRQIHVFRS